MSSLFAALGVSVSGLNAQSEALGNISDDLSNSETTGFKDIGTSFEDFVTASSATDNSPGGVSAAPQYQNTVQGTIAATSTSTNLAISGQGFFQVETATQTASGATQFTGDTYYTRDGDFTENKDGYLINGGGYYLQGHPISAAGVVDASVTQPIQVSASLDAPVATTTVTYAATLPAGAATGYASTPSTIEVYDALGNTHQVSLTWTNTGTNTWNLGIDVANGLGSGTDYTTTAAVTFNGSSNVGTLETIGASPVAPHNYTIDPTSTDAGISFSLAFPGAGTQTIDLNLGTYNSSDGGVTQFANSTSTVSVSSFQQNGLGEGSFSSISINASGIVSINYTNGTAREIYQVPVAIFPSPDSLQRVTGGAYQATLASGTVNLTSASTNGAGSISSSSLEQSTVDIATQFTDLIQAQQIYSANAKTVTTINAMLTTLEQSFQ